MVLVVTPSLRRLGLGAEEEVCWSWSDVLLDFSHSDEDGCGQSLWRRGRLRFTYGDAGGVFRPCWSARESSFASASVLFLKVPGLC